VRRSRTLWLLLLVFVAALAGVTAQLHRRQAEKSRAGPRTPELSREHGAEDAQVSGRGAGGARERPASILPQVGGIVVGRTGPCAAVVEVTSAETRAVLATGASDPAAGSFTIALAGEGLPRSLYVRAHDPASGEASVPADCDITPEFPAAWFMLRLRETVELTGRVVTAAGGPAAGMLVRVAQRSPHHEARVHSGADGRFRARVFGGEVVGRIAVLARESAWSTPVEFRFPPGTEPDVGDLVLPSEWVEWTLRFQDESARACPGVMARLGPEAAWSVESHPAFSREPWVLVADDEGRLRLVLPCGERPTRAVAGGASLRGCRLSLDCRIPGSREQRVLLSRLDGFRAKLVGPSAVELLSSGATFAPYLIRVGPASPPDVPAHASLPTRHVERDPEDWERLFLGGLAYRSWMHPGDVPGERDFHVYEPGTYLVRLELDGWPAAEWPVVVDGGSTVARTVELEAPRGRRVTFDRAALDAWAGSSGDESWLPAFAAWASGPEGLVGPNGRIVAHEEIRCARFLLAGPGRSVVCLWLPAQATGVAFGFCEDDAIAPDTEMYTLRVTDDSPPQLRVPVPAAEFAHVRVSAYFLGKRLASPGIAIEAARDAGNRASVWAQTNAHGLALFRLLPGSYRAAVNGNPADSVEVEFEVAPGAATVDVRVDLE